MALQGHFQFIPQKPGLSGKESSVPLRHPLLHMSTRPFFLLSLPSSPERKPLPFPGDWGMAADGTLNFHRIKKETT